MLSINAIFERKLSALDTLACTIEAIEEMEQDRFENFCNNLLDKQPFIAAQKHNMFMDSVGIIHALLALDMESGDGVLIDCEGYDYARYVAFMPNIKPHIDKQISIVVDHVIEDACLNSENCKYAFDAYQINKDYGLPIGENNGIDKMFLRELANREQLGNIEVVEDVYYVRVKEQYLEQATTGEITMTM